MTPAQGRVLAVSDLHVGYAQNREIVAGLRPTHPDDLLIVAGDVGERFDDVVRILADLAGRFARVVWCPGNHELWSHPSDPVPLRGLARYDALVQRGRDLGVSTPEDPFPTWDGPGGPVSVAPLFVLYDHTFRAVATKEQAVREAYAAGVVCADDRFLDPAPYPSVDEWCADRLAYSARRLAGCAHPPLLVNHWPLTRLPTEILRYPEFAQWCGTIATADWHVRFGAAGVVYGHLHIPRVTVEDGVRFEEVSLGYPREWTRHEPDRVRLRQILPVPS